MIALTHVARPLEGVRLLVVEDDADLRDAVTALLSSEGARVSAARSGNAGFEAFLSEPADVIVSDLWMPDGDGYEFIRRVRRLPPEQGGLVPAIATSAAENMRAALMAGFHVFLAKPFDWEKLLEIVGDFSVTGKVQGRAPWTLSEPEPGRVAITFTGHVGSGDMRAMVQALMIFLEREAVEVLVDLQGLTGFAPSVASVAERAVWSQRRQIKRVFLVGGSFPARLVSAAACKVVGIPCTFCETAADVRRAGR